MQLLQKEPFTIIFEQKVNLILISIKSQSYKKAESIRVPCLLFIYLALPILKDVLPPKYYWNLCALIYGIF